MYRNQRGISMFGMLIVAVVVVIVALAGLKIGPAYMEYFTVKKAVRAVATGENRGGSVSDLRRAFDRIAQVDDISVVGSPDLEITKDGGEVVISFAYPKKVGLFGNVSLLIEFAGSSNK